MVSAASAKIDLSVSLWVTGETRVGFREGICDQSSLLMAAHLPYHSLLLPIVYLSALSTSALGYLCGQSPSVFVDGSQFYPELSTRYLHICTWMDL